MLVILALGKLRQENSKLENMWDIKWENLSQKTKQNKTKPNSNKRENRIKPRSSETTQQVLPSLMAWVLSLDTHGVEATLAKLTSDLSACALWHGLSYICTYVYMYTKNVNKPNGNKEKTTDQNKKIQNTDSNIFSLDLNLELKYILVFNQNYFFSL